jgi:hypothetical protein
MRRWSSSWEVGAVAIVNRLALVVVVLGGALVAVGWCLRWPLWRPARPVFEPLARVLPRPVTLTRLQNRIMRMAIDRITVGVSGTVLAPTALEVVLAPDDVELAGGTGNWLAGRVAETFETAVSARGGAPRRTRVVVTADPRRPVGRPSVHARFEEATVDVGPWEPEAATRLAPPTTTPRPAWTLRSIGQRGEDESVDLDGIELVLGRSRAADARVLDVSVSALHARLRRDERGGWSVVDLGSTNGTFVNGDRLTDRAVRLAEGDQLRIGASTWRVERR